MRRLLFSILATTFLSTLVGCRASHGVCDCSSDYDEPCAYRAPWLNGGPPIESSHEPEIRESLPSAPKKLPN